MISTRFAPGVIVIALALTIAAPVIAQDVNPLPKRPLQERTFQGQPIAFWLNVLRERNEDLPSQAFEAVRSLDEDAAVAVPELTHLVAAPFVAIRPGGDSAEVVAAKVYDIAVRAEAVDTLSWIGPAASRSA